MNSSILTWKYQNLKEKQNTNIVERISFLFFLIIDLYCWYTAKSSTSLEFQFSILRFIPNNCNTIKLLRIRIIKQQQQKEPDLLNVCLGNNKNDEKDWKKKEVKWNET